MGRAARVWELALVQEEHPARRGDGHSGNNLASPLCSAQWGQQDLQRVAILSLRWDRANTAIYSFMDSILLRSLPGFESRIAGGAELAQLRFVLAGTVLHGGSGEIFSDQRLDRRPGIFPFRRTSFFLVRTRSFRACSRISDAEK